MKITDVLRGEHGPLYALLGHLESSAPQWELADLLLAGRIVEAALLSHAELEDELLFAPVEARMGTGGPAQAMREEHQEIDGRFAALRGAADERAARAIALDLVRLTREHFLKEEEVLFPLAESILPGEELERSGGEWAMRRGLLSDARRACERHG